MVVAIALATTTLTSAPSVGHDRALLLHVDPLAVTPIIASIVTATVLIAAITTAASTATSVATIVIVAGLLACCIGSLLLLHHLSLDLFLSLHVRVLLLELLPAQLLIFEHVLDELLNTLTNRANTLITALGVLPDGLEFAEDLVVVILADLAL